MADPKSAEWHPTIIHRFVRSLPTGADTVVVMTDAGEGYLKAMGNDAGEHALACEWVGSQLARWLGLSTFAFALVNVTETNEIPFAKKGNAQPGPAFITRSEVGEPWGGKERELQRLANPGDLGLLVVFDTWTLNCDRYSQRDNGTLRINRNNVFLSEEAPPGQLLLKAMDHTHCFTCGKNLSSTLADIDRTKDARLYGLFPEFRPFLDRQGIKAAVQRLGELDRKTVQEIVQTIPPQWDVNQAARTALINFLLARATYLVDNIIDRLWPQKEFDFGDQPEDQP